MRNNLFGSSSIPPPLQTSQFILEPLKPAHLERDYFAVMSSRLFLNRWSQSSWPSADFSLLENLADLEEHDREHTSAVAYTYTILTTDTQECLGCLYTYPIKRIQWMNESEENRLDTYKAFTRFWMRSDLLNNKLALQVLSSILQWFQIEWQQKEMLYSCNKAVPELIMLYQRAGLNLWIELSKSGRDEQLWRTL